MDTTDLADRPSPADMTLEDVAAELAELRARLSRVEADLADARAARARLRDD